MALTVAWSVEEIEAAVAVEVQGFVATQLEAFAFLFEVDLAKCAVCPAALVDGGVFFCWVPRDEGFFEAGTDDQIGAFGEGGWIAGVVLIVDISIYNRRVTLGGQVLQSENGSR